jgi:hypothetical protein
MILLHAARERRRKWPGGRYLLALAGSLALAGTLTGVTVLAPVRAAATAKTCQWRDGAQPAPTPSDGTLNSVTTPSATQAWAVGSMDDGNGHPRALIEHWNGSAWTISPVPGLGESELLSVRSASPTSIWAVGDVVNAQAQEHTLILHWNGQAWARQPSPDPGNSRDDSLTGVRAVSANNAWAVGSFSNGTDLRSLILHWTGTRWKQVASPSPAPDAELLGVAATSAASAWAVGGLSDATTPLQPDLMMPAGAVKSPRDFILRWNGHTWSQAASPSPGEFDFLEAVGATSATSSWAVGTTGQGRFDQTLILHGDGQTWKQVTSPDPAGRGTSNFLTGVFASSASNAWAVGDTDDDDGSFVLHWDGHRWRTAFGPFGFTELSGVAASSDGTAWAVGNVAGGSGPAQPFALHCT